MIVGKIREMELTDVELDKVTGGNFDDAHLLVVATSTIPFFGAVTATTYAVIYGGTKLYNALKK
jgi:hypothetical protein